MTEPNPERSLYESLWATVEEHERQYDAAVATFMEYLYVHANRATEKPWEICGNLDAFYENERTGDAWYRVQCQFPKGHREDLGIRYHYDDGNEWSSGTTPEEATYPFLDKDPDDA